MTNPKFETWYRSLPERYAPFAPNVPDRAAKQFRFMELDCTRAVKDQRTVEAVLSSELPVMRGGYREILQHSPEAVDLSRAADGLPLLWSHNQEQQIGIAENVRIHDGKLRARLRFSESPLGEEKWRDVQAGILKGISIGYYIEQYDTRNAGADLQDVVAVRWAPFECSAVACPADSQAGMGRDLTRALEGGHLRECPVDLDCLHTEYGTYNRYAFIKPVETLPSIQPAVVEFQRMVGEAKTRADFEEADELLTEIAMRAMRDPAVTRDGTKLKLISEEHTMSKFEPFFISDNSNPRRDRPLEDFSLCRALAATFDPQAARAAGGEMEVMEQFAKTRGKPMTGGMAIPHEILFRAVTKSDAGSGANIVGTDHLASQFIEALRDTLITGQLGATILPGLQGDVSIPRQLTDSSATWINSDHADDVVESDPTLDSVTMSPKTVGAFSVMSRKMILQSSPAAEQMLRETLAFAIAKAIDTAALNGSGSSNQPLGILLTTGINADTYALAGAPDFGDLVDMEGALLIDNAAMQNLGYLAPALMAAALKQTPIVSGQDRMIWTADGALAGRVNGYKALVSNLTPAGAILFGNWRELLIGLWSGLDITVDPYTFAKKGSLQIVVMQDCDVAVRHPAAFAKLTEALA